MSKLGGSRAARWWVPMVTAQAITCSLAGFAVRRKRPRDGHDSPAGESELRVRRAQALAIHDNVLQGLATAKLSFELGRHEQGMAVLDETLDSARRIVSDLHEGMAPEAVTESLRRPLGTRP